MNIVTSLTAAVSGGAVAAVIYAGSIALAALTAIAARTPQRRRDARHVLEVLLRPHRSGRCPAARRSHSHPAKTEES
ncbi:hypothetical protein [Streptacidiphilus melanogenes]|uniref:hypothetical protein n=1 Tax=Streptacidiphilus melanogenes TaxID=411235 RepID=UPI0005AA2138|nr:hypothetical protein [Streptacidiphilus melanogenes]